MLASLIRLSRLFLVVLVVVGGVSCSKTKTQQMRDDEIADRNKYLKENNIPSSARTISGLYYIEEKEGEGELPKAGDKLFVYYTGTFLDGTVFDSNMKDGKFEPIWFFYSPYGGGNVIMGWHEGLSKMKKGGKAKLIIPSSMGYGSYGGNGIPPYTTLVFDIELDDIKRAD